MDKGLKSYFVYSRCMNNLHISALAWGVIRVRCRMHKSIKEILYDFLGSLVGTT